MREAWVPTVLSKGRGPGANPDAGSRRGFLPPPGRSLGPWPGPGSQRWALLPAGPGLSHRLPSGSSSARAPAGGGRAPSSPRADLGLLGPATGQAGVGCAGLTPLGPGLLPSVRRGPGPAGCRPAVTLCDHQAFRSPEVQLPARTPRLPLPRRSLCSRRAVWHRGPSAGSPQGAPVRAGPPRDGGAFPSKGHTAPRAPRPLALALPLCCLSAAPEPRPTAPGAWHPHGPLRWPWPPSDLGRRVGVQMPSGGGPGPLPTGRAWGLGVQRPRGRSAAVLETCLPQNSQIVKNNSGGFCLAFALKDALSFSERPRQRERSAGAAAEPGGRSGGRAEARWHPSTPGRDRRGPGSRSRSGTEGALGPCLSFPADSPPRVGPQGLMPGPLSDRRMTEWRGGVCL